MTGWYENGVGWHLIDGAISGPQNFTDNWVQNTVSGQISGSTFTFTGNPSGTSVYGVQVLNAVPEPSLWAPAAAIALIGQRLRRRRA